MLGRLCCVALLLTSPVLAQQASVSHNPDPQAAVVGELVASDASVDGSLTMAASNLRVMNGATVNAGAHAASVRLVRGGELRVCPETGIALNATASRDLMVSLSAGAFEAHYSLSSSDVVLTPDFRIALAGPGELHVAVGADFRGNACIRSLEGNTASVLVAELMGSRTYQLRPGEQVYFRDGSVDQPSAAPLMTCGCPAQRSLHREVESASTPSPSATPAQPEKAPEEPVSPASLPISMPGDMQVQVDAPLVFSAKEPDPAPEPSTIAELKPLQTPAMFEPLLATNLQAPVPKKRRGFFGRIGGFFAAIFGGK
ncbi:MAG: hypothetical protein L0Z53_26555 [Acidobacteriales bacterium]|nr:hypothetical protein [Terriglobales bacterium]